MTYANVTWTIAAFAALTTRVLPRQTITATSQAFVKAICARVG